VDDRFSYVETAEAGLRIKLYAPGDAPLQEAIDWLWSTGFRPPSELTLKRKKQLDDGRVEYAFG
jgi:hypothetical protein